MPYQGSAQSVGFRQRAVIDPSRRMRQEAEEIERQGQQRIRGMERQASQQIEEMRRVSDIQDSNARYELGVLADLSPTIQKSIKQGVELYAESERAKAMEDYLNQPTEALAQDKAQVDQALDSSAEVHTTLSKLAEKAPNALTEDAVRKRSGFYQQQWHLSAMTEAVQGFGPHLLTELSENTTELQGPDGPFRINDPELTPEQRSLAAKYIKSEWLKANNPAGLSAKVLATKFVPELDKQINFEQQQYTQQYLQKRNSEELEGAKNALFLAYRTGDPAAVVKALDNFRAVSPRLYDNLKTKGGGNLASVEAIRTSWETLALSDPERARELIPVLSNYTVTGHPAGKGPNKSGTMSELFASKGFGQVQMEAFVIKAENADYQARETRENQDANEEYEAITNDWLENPPSTDQKAVALRQLLQNGKRKLYDKLVDWEAPYKGKLESENYIKRYLASSPTGEIPRDIADKLHPDVRAQYQNKIVENLFGSDNKAEIKKGKELIKAALDEVRGDIDGTKNATDDYLRVRNKAEKDMMLVARQLRDADPNLSEGQAITMAADQITELIQGTRDKKGSDYHYTTNGGFTKFMSGPAANTALLRQNNIVSQAETLIKTQPNVITTRSFNFQPADLELNSNGRPSGVFYSLAALDKKHTAHEIMNAQRRLQQPPLKEIPLPKEANYLEQALKASPALRNAMITKPSYKIAQRTVEQVGGISTSNMLRAIGFQESGGNYKAQNRDPATGNDRDPALGKYQMLWSNIVVWGPKYGLGHPGSQEAFLNNPDYQERMAQVVMGEYIRQAVNASGGDLNQAVRRAAAFWYGGDKGFNNWNNPRFSGGPGYPNMEQYTRSVLQHYVGGN